MRLTWYNDGMEEEQPSEKDKEIVRTTIVLSKDHSDWVKRQDVGISVLIRTLIEQARKGESKIEIPLKP